MKTMKRWTALLMALMMLGAAAISALAAGEATGSDLPATGTDVTVPPVFPSPIETNEPEPTVPMANPYVTEAPPAVTGTMPGPDEFVRRVTALLEGLDADAVTRTGNAIRIKLDETDVLTCFFGGVNAITLTSGYSAEVLAGFKGWLATLNGEATKTNLIDSENFAGFINGAKVLVNVVLPDLTVEETDTLLTSILTNGAEGVTLTDEEITARFGEGVNGEVLSVYGQDGYSFCLLLAEDSIVLSVIEAK